MRTLIKIFTCVMCACSLLICNTTNAAEPNNSMEEATINNSNGTTLNKKEQKRIKKNKELKKHKKNKKMEPVVKSTRKLSSKK